MPPLVRCALMHYQIETIHPYSDGNGRIGRLLITLFLSASGLLRIPLLYLSAYFERNRESYYEELLNVSATGDWERWLRYFLRGVRMEAGDVVERLRSLQDEWRELLVGRKEAASVLRLLDEFFARPILTVSQAAEVLGISDAGTRRVLGRLINAGIVTRQGDRWPHLYVSRRLLEEIDRPISLEETVRPPG